MNQAESQEIAKALRLKGWKEKDSCREGLNENHIRVRIKERDLRDEIKVVKIEKQKGGILYGRAAVDND